MMCNGRFISQLFVYRHVFALITPHANVALIMFEWFAPVRDICQLPRFITVLFMALIVVAQPTLASAQSRQLPIVRDAEIEELLNDYAQPLLKAAGIRRDRVDIILVNSKSFNAFVSGTRIFMHTGAIVEAETPNEIIGVLAHEIGHLAGGHQDRLRQQLDRAQIITVVGSLLGLAAAVAAGASGNGAGVGAGGGIAAGSTEAARRGLLAYQRSEEQSADRAALDYLNATGQSGMGLLKTFERFERNIALNRDRINPYRISHPLPRDRIVALEQLVKASPNRDKKDSASLQRRHDMARAKILAYSYGSGAVESLARDKPNSSAAQYGRAIAQFLYGNPREGARSLDVLIAKSPNNPYLHELRGEAMLIAGDADEAVKSLSTAVRLTKGRETTMLVGLGHALVLKGDEQSLRRAVGELEVAASIDPFNARAYRHLAMAYGRLGDNANAELATAEEKFYTGQYKDAKIFAARAKSRFQRSDPQWLRADDITNFKIPKQRR